MTLRVSILWALSVLCLWAGCSRHDPAGEGPDARAEEPLRLAVAANFASPAKRLARVFEKRTSAEVEISTGSSGKLYAQIRNGAPFHVFLSADAQRPQKLEERGLAVKSSRLRYALGKLVLYGPALKHEDDGTLDLKRGNFHHLAVANPKIAPYGAAAKQVLEKLKLWDELEPRIARGENIAQAYQFVESGGAELGLVALSSVFDAPKHRYWPVPAKLHDPIRQDAVLLRRGARHPHGRAFLSFLRSEPARAIIKAAGYSTE